MKPTNQHKKGLQNLPNHSPNPELWDRIEAQLPEEKSRRGGFFWMVGLAASIVLLLGILYVLNGNDQPQMVMEETSEPNPYQTETILMDELEDTVTQAPANVALDSQTDSIQTFIVTDSLNTTYTWEFGDNYFASNGAISHSYSNTAGTYNVTLGNASSTDQWALTYSTNSLKADANSKPNADMGYIQSNAARKDERFRMKSTNPGLMKGDLDGTDDVLDDDKSSDKYVPWHDLKLQELSDGYADEDYTQESYAPLIENTFTTPQKDPLSTFGIDVDNASYSVMRTKLTMNFPVPKDAVRVEEFVNYFDYNYPQPKSGHPFSVNLESATCPWNTQHQLVRIGLKGKDIDYAKKEASNLVFLIDVSGSMDEENKLPLVKKSLKLLVDQLGPEDRIAVVTYAGSSGLALSSTTCTDKNKDLIKKKIQKLDAGGSTAGGQGIELAYKVASENLLKEGNNRVILCTDGDFNVGSSSDSDMKNLIQQKRDQNIFITVCGFGMGNYKDSKMEVIADNGNGNYFYIDTYKESTRVFERDLRATLFTIAKDVKIQVEFNPSHVKAYRLIGYENRLMPAQDFNDDSKDGGELGAGHTVTALYEIIPAGSDEAIPDAPELKYQQNTSTNKDFKNELFTVKLRYKEPKGTISKLLETSLLVHEQSFQKASADFQLAAGVAYYAQQLRQSEFVTDRNFNHAAEIIQLARPNPNEDVAELLSLIKMAESIYQVQADQK